METIMAECINKSRKSWFVVNGVTGVELPAVSSSPFSSRGRWRRRRRAQQGGTPLGNASVEVTWLPFFSFNRLPSETFFSPQFLFFFWSFLFSHFFARHCDLICIRIILNVSPHRSRPPLFRVMFGIKFQIESGNKNAEGRCGGLDRHRMHSDRGRFHYW